MEIHIDRAGQRYGPYPLDQIESMLSQGQLLGSDMAWHEGMSDWKPLEHVVGAGFSTSVQSKVDGFSASIGGAWTIGGCVSDGFDAFKTNIGGCILFSIVFFIVFAIGMAIPLVNLFLMGPLAGGALLFFIRQARGLANGVGDVFAGFNNVTQLMLWMIVIVFIMILATVPGNLLIYFGAASFYAGILEAIKGFFQTGEFAFPSLAGASILVILLGHFLIFAATNFFAVKWIFSGPLVVDKGLGFWEAMQASSAKVKGQWWKLFGLLLVTNLIASLGACVLCIGMLFTIPIAACAMGSCYVRNFDK